MNTSRARSRRLLGLGAALALAATWIPATAPVVAAETTSRWVAGPLYRWYSTTGALSAHHGGGKIRALVDAESENRASILFDVAKVSVTYQYGVFK